MLTNKFNFVALLFTIFVTFSCSKKEESVVVLPLTTTKFENLAADPVTISPIDGKASGGTNRFTLFSFKNNAIITNADSASNKWDIGFRGTSIIFNGGAMRVGQGGLHIHTGIFDDLKEIPATAVFKTDESPLNLAMPAGSGVGWYNYNPAALLISPIPGRVLVVRTGDGKYAKMEILNYYKDSPAKPDPNSARFYTFRFVYQPDGTKKF
ncbi:MAG: hypothetical protein EAZ97_12845 [Bacteroidetes bacterium]|nr:MAG: hypothetical protein EAZ97_12845 [Bacteroidota bacterium]